ncbi:MAG: DNA-packaging protein [Gammaproteobacteria bacterium]|nr:DNA-packaging protein [Gammaproteobacteria bacterium]
MTEVTLKPKKLHPTQREVFDKLTRFNVMRMGRRWGKTTIAEEYFLEPVLAGKPCGFMSPTYKMLSQVWREFGNVYAPIISRRNVQEKRYDLVTGGSIDFWSAESADSARGRKYYKFFVDEAAMIRELIPMMNEVIMPTLIDYGGGMILGSTPRGMNDFRLLDQKSEHDPDWSSFHFTTYDNPLLDPADIAILEASMTARAVRQEIYADYLDNSEFALFNYDDIEAARVAEAPLNLQRIVVGVDPAATSKKTSNMTSIVTAARKGDDYYIMSDDTGIYKPLQWAQRVVNSYRMWNADRIIGEVNNGGDMIESNIRTIDSSVSYKSVHASRGKAIRAEPIAALYEQGLVHHVGNFRELETQMTTWSPHDGDSPDRIDAMVWALTELSGPTMKINTKVTSTNYMFGEPDKDDDKIGW